MDSVVVSGFGAEVGLGRLGETWALVKDAKANIDTRPTGKMTRAMDRNIKNPPTSAGGQPEPLLWSKIYLRPPQVA